MDPVDGIPREPRAGIAGFLLFGGTERGNKKIPDSRMMIRFPGKQGPADGRDQGQEQRAGQHDPRAGAVLKKIQAASRKKKAAPEGDTASAHFFRRALSP